MQTDHLYRIEKILAELDPVQGSYELQFDTDVSFFLDTIGITYSVASNRINIPRIQQNFVISKFYNQFCSDYFNTKKANLTKTYILLNTSAGETLSYSDLTTQVISSRGESEFTGFHICKNFYEFIHTISLNDDFIQKTNNCFVVTTQSVNKPVLDLSYKSVLSDNCQYNQDLRIASDVFMNNLAHQPSFIDFLRAEFVYEVDNAPLKEELNFFFCNLNGSVNKIIKRYNVYKSQFSFEKIIKKFESEKQKLLDNSRDANSKIQNVLAGTSVALALSALYSANIPHNMGIKILLWITFLIFTVFSTIYTSMIMSDVVEQNQSANDYFDRVSKESSIVREEISDTVKYIQDKFDKTKILISCNYILLWLYFLIVSILIFR